MHARRYDIDWLRVIAIGFLLIYHVAIPFQPWGVFIGFIQSPEMMESLWIPMSMLNVWRIPLLFFVSGMGVYFSMRKRNWKTLLKERAVRILVPLIAGSLLIVPIQSVLWQVYYNQELKPMFFPAHLWFLGNIFIYVLLLVPILFYMKKHEELFRKTLAKAMNHPIKLILFTIPFIISVMLIQPESYATYAFTWNGFVLGFIAFFLGYLFVFAGAVFWEVVARWKWVFLIAGFSMYLVRLIEFDMEAPGYLMSIEMTVWIYAILGIGYTYLNFSNSRLKYLSEAAYPVYIVHWVFINLACMWLFPIDMPVFWKFIGVVVITFSGSIGFYHLILRNINFIRPLFGLKLNERGMDKPEIAVSAK